MRCRLAVLLAVHENTFVQLCVDVLCPTCVQAAGLALAAVGCSSVRVVRPPHTPFPTDGGLYGLHSFQRGVSPDRGRLILLDHRFRVRLINFAMPCLPNNAAIHINTGSLQPIAHLRNRLFMVLSVGYRRQSLSSEYAIGSTPNCGMSVAAVQSRK